MPHKELKQEPNSRILRIEDIPGALFLEFNSFDYEISEPMGKKELREDGIPLSSIKVSAPAYELIFKMAQKCEQAGRKFRVFYDDVDDKILGFGFRWSTSRDDKNFYITPNGKLKLVEYNNREATGDANKEDFERCFKQFLANAQYAVGEGAARVNHVRF